MAHAADSAQTGCSEMGETAAEIHANQIPVFLVLIVDSMVMLTHAVHAPEVIQATENTVTVWPLVRTVHALTMSRVKTPQMDSSADQ